MVRLPAPPYTRPGWPENDPNLKHFEKRKAETSSIWISDDMQFLRDAVSTWADRNISDWNGAEKDARRSMGPPKRPWRRRDDGLCLIYDNNDDEQIVSEEEAEKWWAETEPSLIKEWEAESQELKRWHDAVSKFRNFLASGDLVGQILTKSGALFGIRKERWRAKDAGQFFSDGFAK